MKMIGARALIECLKKWFRRSALPEHLDLLERLSTGEGAYVQ